MKGTKTGGRKAGTPNRATEDLIAKANRLGCDPFDILLHFAKGDWEALGYDSSVYVRESKDGTESVTLSYVITPEVRAKAAIEACKYLFPQKKAIQIDSNLTINNPFQNLTVDEKIEKAREVVALLEEQKK